MRYLKENPRKSVIMGLYMLAFLISVFFFGVSMPVLVLIYLLLTLLLIAVFFVDSAAMLGNLFYARGQADRAANILRFAVAHNTKSPAAHLHYGIYLLRRDRAKEAMPILDKAFGLNPKGMTHKNLMLTKASCRWVTGDVDGAINELENMRKTFDYVNAQAISTLAYMYFLKGNIEKAEALTQAALEDTPTSAAAWDNLGQIRFYQKNNEQAREAFLKALEYKENLPDSFYYLGLIAQAENDAAKAAEYFNRALACPINPLNTVTRAQIEEALARVNA